MFTSVPPRSCGAGTRVDATRHLAADAFLHPPIEPGASGRLAVDGRHTLYWEECGARDAPVIVFLQIIPKIAIAPLFIIWFGFGFTPKVLLVFLLSFFPIVVASIAGFKSADRDVMDFARTTGASGLRMFLKISLPQALPQIFTGLKVGAALAATAAVVAEFVASDKGLGYLLLQYNGQLDTPMVFAIIVLLSLIGLAVYYAVEIIERIAIPWHVSQQSATHDAVL